MANAIRAVFNAPNLAEAERLLNIAASRYEKEAPDLATWMLNNVPESLVVFHFTEAHRRRLRTSNVVERINKEIKRRTRVATLFPNAESCQRLVTAVLVEIHEEWQSGKIYLTM